MHIGCALTCVYPFFRETVVTPDLLEPWALLVPLELLDLVELLADPETVERL